MQMKIMFICDASGKRDGVAVMSLSGIDGPAMGAAPVWMGSPPEVHSALLSGGPGPGPLLSSASAWASLSAEYAAVADELVVVLSAVRGGFWAGPTAARYGAAHLRYLEWLLQSSAVSADLAASHDAFAAAYTAALATMPTLGELAGNHASHGALSATNFFGINTIPIAVNEADYVRMWIQAATTMNGYQAVSETVLTAGPRADLAPHILQHSAAADSDPDEGFPDPTISNPIDMFVADFLRVVTGGRVIWDPASGTVNGLPYDAYVDAGQPIFWIVRALELGEDFQEFGTYLVQNPALALQYLVSLEAVDWPTHIAEIAAWLSQTPQLLAATLGGAVANLGTVTGVAGLAGLAGVPAVPPPSALPIAAAAPTLPIPGAVPTVVGTATGPVSTPAPVTGAPAGATPTPPPPAPGGPGGLAGLGFPYAITPPGVGFGSGMSAGAGAGAKRTAAQPDSAVSAAAAATRERARARRRKATAARGFGDEFLDMDVEVDPEWATQSSRRGADLLGFAGALPNEKVREATGLTTLAGDEFGGSRMPLLPKSWRPDDVNS
jgi:PPE-repeat protein